MMTERGVVVDHTMVHRWAIKMMPMPAWVFPRRRRPVGRSRRAFFERAIDLHSSQQAITLDAGAPDTAGRPPGCCSNARYQLSAMQRKQPVARAGFLAAQLAQLLNHGTGQPLFVQAGWRGAGH